MRNREVRDRRIRERGDGPCWLAALGGGAISLHTWICNRIVPPQWLLYPNKKEKGRD